MEGNISFTEKQTLQKSQKTLKPLLCQGNKQEERRHCLYLKTCPSWLENSQISIKEENLYCHGTQSESLVCALRVWLHSISLSLSCMHGFPFTFTREPFNVPFTQYSTYRGVQKKSIECCDVESILNCYIEWNIYTWCSVLINCC